MYKTIIRPILFQVDPEKVHNKALKLGSFFGKFAFFRKFLALFYDYRNDKLEVNVCGIHFRNPIGLAAGFDKNGVLFDIIPSIGFGFEEIGSVTALPCEGNLKPRLFRLIKDKVLVVNYGLCNDGVETVHQRLANKKFGIPIGINIAKTNDKNIKGNKSVDDYWKSYEIMENIGDYITINISCPNSGDGRSFEDPRLLEKLLSKLKMEKPVFLKISPDIDKKKLSEVLKLSKRYSVSGFVVANLTHDRSFLKTKNLDSLEGGISGFCLKEKTDDLISYIYKKTKGKFVIIGVGGIFNAGDAYRKIRNGASLLQLITGMIYEGPSIVKKINKELVELLERDGFKNIEEAVGVDAR
ncbi:quinone-dependent dihydroorotate dehydrogenase [Candidatus Woesearchaeota archaeon]|nr:quinone-dependent dihydroorotate dehydrogenase [Candidatus Woesearchaeota archaeon]